MDEVGEFIPCKKRVVTEADFNGHIGEGNRCDEQVWCSGKELGKADGGGFCRKNGKGFGENLLPKEGKTKGDIGAEVGRHMWTTFL